MLLCRRSCPEVALQFMHCLVTDLVFVLDEAIAKVRNPHVRSVCILDVSCMMQSESVSAAESSAEASEQRSLVQLRRHLRIVSALATEALRTLVIMAGHSGMTTHCQLTFTDDSADIATGMLTVMERPEMVERLAHTINYYVVRLLPLTQSSTEAHARLGFNPAAWLKQFAVLYLRLGHSHPFNRVWTCVGHM